VRASDDILERPQPVGIFALPAGYLLLPPTTDRSAAAALLAGKLPASWPEEWRFFAAALAGDTRSAMDSLMNRNDPLAAYNRFVLAPDLESFASARSFDPLRSLVDVVGYSLGYLDRPPSHGTWGGELLAHALSANAAFALAAGDFAAAVAHLKTAATASREPSPLFAALLLGQLAALIRDDPELSAEAPALYQDAIRLADDTPLVRLRAELWLALGASRQEAAAGRRGPLLEAVKAYQQAVQCGLSLEAHPDLYAEAQNNLGLAYLSVPVTAAGDQLRTAVAIQSFREALKVYTRESAPKRWASTTLNMANALQYMPSGEPAQRLMQAVELYEEVLTVRTRADDPIGYARVLANQGNALSHLGQFAQALEKLGEAHKLFHWYDEATAAASVLEQVERISDGRERTAGLAGT
jgi:tetratricopeptide (TPR) repeat protein